MTDRDKFASQVISGLCANERLMHDFIHSSTGAAKKVVALAKEITDEYFNTPTA